MKLEAGDISVLVIKGMSTRMSIGPLDYQILMPKVNETGKIQSELQQKMINQAQQQVDNSVKQSERDIKSVHTQSEAQKIVITEDQRQRQNQQHKNYKKADGEKKEKKEDEKLLPQERHTIDIRI